jgi:predicted DNA-binding transcriptional regulator AlpA
MQIQEYFYTKKQVCFMIGKAPATLDRWEKDGMFPERHVPPNAKPVRDKATGKVIRKHNCRVGYPKAEVHEWIAGTWKPKAKS